jgi:hypothetical protein
MANLERIRMGRPGLILFYGYLVAILITGILVVGALFHLNNTDNKLQQSDVRFCIAVHGAADFWKHVRATTTDILRDPSLSPVARRSNANYLLALDTVIARADIPSCRTVKP